MHLGKQIILPPICAVKSPSRINSLPRVTNGAGHRYLPPATTGSILAACGAARTVLLCGGSAPTLKTNSGFGYALILSQRCSPKVEKSRLFFFSFLGGGSLLLYSTNSAALVRRTGGNLWCTVPWCRYQHIQEGYLWLSTLKE